MSKSLDRSQRQGDDPLIIGSSKLATDSNNNLSVLDSSDAPKKLIASELEIGDSSNKVIIKKGSDNKVQFQTQASGGSATDSNAGGGVTVVANTTALNALTGNAVGDLAFVTANNKLYIRQSGGWYTVATGSNATPVISSAGNASYTLANDGTAVVVTVTATDDEGETITYNYNVSSGSLTNGGGATATVTQGTGSNVNQFTITPTTTQAYAGNFSLTFTAQDPNGNTATSSASAFSLQWFQQMFVPSGTTMLLGLSFDNSGLGKSGSWNTPTTVGTGGLTFYTSGGYNSTMAGHAGYPSGGTSSNGYTIAELNPGSNPSRGKTFVIWYKGTQTTIGGAYSIGVPILGDPAIGWSALGIDDGKISTQTGVSQFDRGTTNVADGNWHMLAWVHSDGTHTRFSNNQMGMYVDGVYEATHTLYAGGPPHTDSNLSFHDMFMVYGNSWDQPTKVDAFQIFDSELTDAQILSIYNGS